jgi:hypothetical protein
MAKFTVKSPLKFDGKRYEIGKTVEIKDERTEVIEPLLMAGVIEPKKGKADDKDPAAGSK